MALQNKRSLLLGLAVLAATCCISTVNGAIVSSGNGTSKQASAAATKCAKYNFKPLDNICCKSSPGELIAWGALTGCKRYKNRANYQVIDRYILNRANAAVGVKKYNLQTKRARLQLESGPICFAECAFRNLSLLNDEGEMDFTATEKYITNVIDGLVGWTDTITNAMAACETFVTGMENKTVNVGNYQKCQAQPAVYMQCLQSYIILGCPTADKKTTTWCTTRLAEFKACNYFSTS